MPIALGRRGSRFPEARVSTCAPKPDWRSSHCCTTCGLKHNMALVVCVGASRSVEERGSALRAAHAITDASSKTSMALS